VTPDVDVLVAASRSDHPHHAAACAWLEQAITNASQGSPLKLQPMVIASLLRLVTHPRIFIQPTPMSEALRFVDALLTASGVEQPKLGAEWPVFRELCAAKALVANAVPDAWLAAAVVHQGENLVSFDADFKRLLASGQFTRLKV
jgi:toxin-antitoxin system PIN domain toxin